MKREKSSLASIKNAHRKKKWKRTSLGFSHLSEATFSFPSPSAPQAKIGNKRFSLLTVAIVEPEEMNESAGAAEIFRENSAGDLQNFLWADRMMCTPDERGWRARGERFSFEIGRGALDAKLFCVRERRAAAFFIVVAWRVLIIYTVARRHRFHCLWLWDK